MKLQFKLRLPKNAQNTARICYHKAIPVSGLLFIQFSREQALGFGGGEGEIALHTVQFATTSCLQDNFCDICNTTQMVRSLSGSFFFRRSGSFIFYG